MHWTLGKRRPHSGSATDAAGRTAKATRVAATIGLVGALLASGGAIAAELVDQDSTGPTNCTAEALTDYMYLYDDGPITHSEFEDLRADAIDDELTDQGECS
jgi:hypothetical protein